MKTLEQLLRMLVPVKDKDENEIKISPEFRVSIQQISKEKPGGVHFIIHPEGYNGDTLDFIVMGNELIEFK